MAHILLHEISYNLENKPSNLHRTIKIGNCVNTWNPILKRSISYGFIVKRFTLYYIWVNCMLLKALTTILLAEIIKNLLDSQSIVIIYKSNYHGTLL